MQADLEELDAMQVAMIRTEAAAEIPMRFYSLYACFSY
jgi:hypothetical protein